MGYAPSAYSSEALLHYASPNWLADVTLCLGVASPPFSIKGATQRHYDIQKPLLASHQKPLTNFRTNDWPPRRFSPDSFNFAFQLIARIVRYYDGCSNADCPG